MEFSDCSFSAFPEQGKSSVLGGRVILRHRRLQMFLRWNCLYYFLSVRLLTVTRNSLPTTVNAYKGLVGRPER